MNEYNLRRVFDQVKPSPRQEDAMLERILEKAEQTGKRRYPLPRLATVTVAAAVLLTTGVFAAVWAGLDGRLLDYFGATPDNEALLTPAAVVVDQKVEDQGSTLHLRQIITDRYSAVALMDFIAPEGTVLDGDNYDLKWSIDVQPTEGSAWGAIPLWELLEDEDGADNRITLLMRVDFPFPERGDTLGATLTLEFDGLYSDGAHRDLLVPGHWEFQVTLPETDPGRYVTVDAPFRIQEANVTLTSLYLSPISLEWTIGAGGDALDFTGMRTRDFYGLEDDEWWKVISIFMADGETISPGEFLYTGSWHEPGRFDGVFEGSHYYFRLDEIIDPAQVTAVRLFGQTFSMEPTEE